MTNIMTRSCDLLKHYPHVQAASVTIKAATNDNANDNTEDNGEKTLNYYYCPKSSKTSPSQSKTDASKKPALLFLHGILGDGRTFLPLPADTPSTYPDSANHLP